LVNIFTRGVYSLRKIIFGFHHLYAKRNHLNIRPLELGGEQYTVWKNELIMIERYILKELGFSLYNIMDHPHKYILYFIKVLNGNEELANLAWSYLNDSMRLDISLRYEAHIIACGAIYLAARKIGFPLPEHGPATEEQNGGVGPWWKIMATSQQDMLSVCSEILSLYHIPKVLPFLLYCFAVFLCSIQF
jgi:cyclin L